MMDEIEITQMLRDSVVSFLEAHAGEAGKQVVLDVPSTVDSELWAEMAELGWLGLALPESVGGSGLSLREAVVLTELFGQHAFSAPYIGAVVMPSAILSRATGPLAEDMASRLCTGESYVTLAWQEVRGEVEPSLPATELLDGRLVNGTKSFVPLLETNTLILLSARAGDEWVVVGVDASAPGVSWRSSATALGAVAELTFDRVEIIGDGPLLSGEEARQALRHSLEAGRIALAAQLAGLAEGCLSRTLGYTSERVQFGKPLGSMQSVRHRCADMHISVMLARASWRNALSELETRGLESAAVAAVSAAKARCADTAMQVTRESVQLHGAMGFTEEGGIGQFLRAAMAGSGWLGSPTAHRRRFYSAQEGAL